MPLSDGDLRIDAGSRTVSSRLITGGSYFRQAGVEHNATTGLISPAASSRWNCLRTALSVDNADGDEPFDSILHGQAGQSDRDDVREHYCDLFVQPRLGDQGQTQDDAACHNHRQQHGIAC